MPCQCCKFECFVLIPKETPSEMASAVKEVFTPDREYLLTCAEGQLLDKALTGTNYGEIMAAICAQEDHAILDRLFYWKTRAKEAILHLFDCKFDESIEFQCTGCVAAHELLDEMKNG